MRKIKSLWHWYVRGGIPDSASISQLRKLQFINIISLLGFMACMPFSLIDLPKYKVVGSFEMVSAIIYLLAGLSLRFLRRARLATNLIILATFLLIIMLAITGGGDGAGIVWLLVFPPMLFFLEDWKASFIWVGLLLMTLGLLYFTGHLYSGYDTYIYQHTSYAIIVISIVVYFYQDINRQAERITEKAKRELFKSNQKLHLANANLAKAKANVEEQVVERTQSLIKEHARLEASVGSLPLGFILTDQNLFVANINAEAKKILGDFDQSNGESYSKILHEELNLVGPISEVMSTKKRININEKLYKDRFLQITVAPIILGDKSEVIGVIVLIEDITEKKIIARARDEFFLVASHELRTPLTIVEGNISIIKEHFLSEIKNVELRHMIDNAYDSTERLTYIVNQLLTVSALELGEVSLQMSELDLVKNVEKIIHKFESVARQKKLSLKMDHESRQTAIANLDPERFGQVLDSLIDNAIRNTDEGSITVKIESKNDRAKIIVTDTGRGISEDNQALLFHKFHQSGDNVLVRDKNQSIGLGLYLSKLLIEKMSGKIYLQESIAGKGSSFVLEVPIKKNNKS